MGRAAKVSIIVRFASVVCGGLRMLEAATPQSTRSSGHGTMERWTTPQHEPHADPPDRAARHSEEGAPPAAAQTHRGPPVRAGRVRQWLGAVQAAMIYGPRVIASRYP